MQNLIKNIPIFIGHDIYYDMTIFKYYLKKV